MMAESSVGRIFFEITDVVLHARQGNRRVTGIQRVQLNLINLVTASYGAARVRCICYHEHYQTMVEFAPDALFATGEFDGERFLFQLGMIHGWGRLPSRFSVKHYLRSAGKNKLLRIWKKMDVYVSALLLPSRFKRTGLKRISTISLASNPVAVEPIKKLDMHDSLVFLGINWSAAEVVNFACHHAAVGGDVVQLMYDLIPSILPEYCTEVTAREFNYWVGQVVVPHVSRLMCISECTAHDLRDAWPQLQTREMAVVRLAHEFSGYERNAIIKEALPVLLQGKGPFVLCVGTIEIRKNGVALLKSWLQLHAQLGDQLPLLVFAGKRGWLSEEFDQLMASEPLLQQRVLITEAPSDRDLAALYQSCLFTVYPSKYEGWGLPVGESAWFGKYCLVSTRSSLPEVCGELMDYVDPDHIPSLVLALHRAISDRDYVRNREAQIRAATLRSWQDVADDMWRFLVGKVCIPEMNKAVVS